MSDDNSQVGIVGPSIPPAVAALCWSFDAWVVGGRAEGKRTGDWDVIVPPHNWLAASMCLSGMLSARPSATSLGGFEYDMPGGSLQVWPDTLDSYLLRVPPTWPQCAIHPKSGTRIQRTHDIRGEKKA